MTVTIVYNNGKTGTFYEVFNVRTTMLNKGILIISHHGCHAEFFKTGEIKSWNVDTEGEYKPTQIDDRGILSIGEDLTEEEFKKYMKKIWEEDDASSQQG